MTGSRNSRWWSSKPEVPIFQLVEELATRFQIIIPCFLGRETQWYQTQHCQTTTEVGIVVNTIGLLDPKNIGLAVGIALLSVYYVEI